MKRFAKCLSSTPALAFLATTIVLISAAPAGSAVLTPAVPVTIVNTPVPVQGTVNANVTGTVGVSSLPAVQLSGTPTVNLNTAPTAPLYVDSDRPARNGFNASCATGNIDPTYGQASCTLFTIPAGRQIVIETISCQAELFAGQGPGDVQLIVPNSQFPVNGTDHVSHMLTLAKQSSSPNLDIWRMTSPLKAYGSSPSGGSVDVGLFFRADPASPNPQGILCTISGYIVGQ